MLQRNSNYIGNNARIYKCMDHYRKPWQLIFNKLISRIRHDKENKTKDRNCLGKFSSCRIISIKGCNFQVSNMIYHVYETFFLIPLLGLLFVTKKMLQIFVVLWIKPLCVHSCIHSLMHAFTHLASYFNNYSIASYY